MSIAKIIAKYLKEGFGKLSKEEKTLLSENKDLLEKEQREKFESEVKEDEEIEEDEEAEEEAEEDEEFDEKALKGLIQKAVKDEVDKGGANAKLAEKIADILVGKFVSKAYKERQKAIDAGKEAEKKDVETRRWLKALADKDNKTLKEIHEKATSYNNTGTDAQGGYLVPDELLAEVLRIMPAQYGLCRREMRYLPFSGPGNERKIPTLASSVAVYWIDEAGNKTSSNPTFGLVTQTLKKLVALVPMTMEIIEDSAINLTQEVATLIAEAMSKEEDDQFLNGTGSPWTGVLNNGSVNSVSLGAGESFADVTFEKLIDMQDSTPAGALAGSKYYMHRHMLSVLRKKRADAITASDSAGAFLMSPMSKAAIEDYLGYPIELSEALPDNTTTTAAAPIAFFGNLRLASIIGDKQALRTTLLDQATIYDADGTTPLNLALMNMVALRVEERVGYVMALPTAITVLKNGAAS